MNRSRRSAIGRIMAFTSFWLFVIGAAAQGGKSDSETAPVYKPPLRGAPASRVGGGSRGVGTDLPRIYVLAPPDIGFTTKGKPDLFWFVSEATDAKVTLSVYKDNADKPILEQTLGAISAPGVQRVRLADFGLELQPRIEYRWRISVINDSGNRQARAIAGGAIQRTNPWPKLQSRLQNHDALERAGIYAEEGLWYDAIELISDSIDADPNNTGIRKQRAGLLEQVGLTEASRYDAGQK